MSRGHDDAVCNRVHRAPIGYRSDIGKYCKDCSRNLPIIEVEHNLASLASHSSVVDIIKVFESLFVILSPLVRSL